MKNNKEFEIPTVDAVKTFLACAEQGEVSEKIISSRIKMITREMKDMIRFDTQDLEIEACLHTNYVTK